jgi:hypothetical protein
MNPVLTSSSLTGAFIGTILCSDIGKSLPTAVCAVACAVFSRHDKNAEMHYSRCLRLPQGEAGTHRGSVAVNKYSNYRNNTAPDG